MNIGNLVAMREEKVENMAADTTPRAAKRQRRSAAATPSPLSTPAGSMGPTMSDDMYMMMDEDDKTSASVSGRSGTRGDKEVLRIVTQGDFYDDGYRYALLHVLPYTCNFLFGLNPAALLAARKVAMAFDCVL